MTVELSEFVTHEAILAIFLLIGLELVVDLSNFVLEFFNYVNG